ncbi:MAG: YceI family protein [Opitutales bacterium]|jgi:polyisoprenoid-binding protein YceI|nr:YceI family protein [Opitutales bacterium]MBT5813238.1 YceI family protein [Opitutales bacterium]MBT6769151.1 YceI family protein [Opitutales bacterium]
MIKRILGTITGILLAFNVFAGSATFDFTDPSGVSNLSFDMTAPVESISGSADGISGSIDFDPAKPEATNGTISVATSSLMVPKGKMRDHIMGSMWMDAKKYPEMTFKLSGVSGLKAAGDGVFKGQANGTMTVKGVAKELNTEVTIKHLVGKLGAKLPGKKGDLLVVSGTLIVNRDAFNINAGQKLDKVANDIHIGLNFIGYSEN